ncbi:hypothetical protein [Chromobacterium subtsugae]|uniref:hypothetical protein n=1 Tax=Chromobacterium subtsugae TaxID=251747 RepID=UPI00064114E3|nr:hypothetical protein [Chromobacterium subtsugae]
MWVQKVVPYLFMIPFVYYIYFETMRRDRIAREMADQWLKTNHPGCVIKSMKTSKLGAPIAVVMQVYTPKDEDFEIKLKVGTIFGGIFAEKVKVVYVRKIKLDSKQE